MCLKPVEFSDKYSSSLSIYTNADFFINKNKTKHKKEKKYILSLGELTMHVK